MTADSQTGAQTDVGSDVQVRPRSRKKLWIALAIVSVIVALLVLPPLVSLNRYKGRITQLVSTALQRPVTLSGVELRILPVPGFVISDLTVAADPAFDGEPVLHANTVTASIRLWSLWRGKLQLGRVSVDEASLNLVRSADGRWNIEDLFHTAARHNASGSSPVPFPYLEATSSRINLKDGVEKLPFSLLDADASLWQDSDGAWHVRLRGQPARTDVSLDLADTGIVRAEATLHPAPTLEQMPLHLDLDWRQAQLGQLSRLLLGSDEGWRGDLTGELHLDGTVESAHVQSRLRASGVHRAEFAPAAPLDFDASCSFVFHSAQRTLQNLLCDSPIGNGRARITGDLAFSAAPPDLTVALDRVPAQAGLDLLRTVRNDLDPGLQAAGSVSGKISYQPASAPPAPAPQTKAPRAKSGHTAAGREPASPLSGTLTVQGLSISGGPLTHAVSVDKLLLEPAPQGSSERTALATTFPIPAGGPAPLTVTARIALGGFQLGIHGSASLPRLRELAQAAGFPQVKALSQIAGEPAVINLTAQGPWLPSILPVGASNGSMNGTVDLKDANWRSSFLATPVLVPSATLHFDNGALRWSPVAFSFASVKGTATLEIPPPCVAPAECNPQFTVRFASLDAGALQAALLGAPHSGSLFSSLLARFDSSSAPLWPRLEGSVQADILELGPFTLRNVVAHMRILSNGADVTSFDAQTLGGSVQGNANLDAGDKPSYTVDGQFAQLNSAQVGQLFGIKWTGGNLSGSAHVQLSGHTQEDFASSATGTLHFDWPHGSVASLAKSPVPPALAHFDRWTADALIGKNSITLLQNTVTSGRHTSSVHGSASFGIPAPVTFDEATPKPEGKLP